MILEATLAAVIAVAATASPRSNSASDPASRPPKDMQTETLWRGVPWGDSLFVRARWVPTALASSCGASRTIELDDSVSIGRTFLEYTIEGSGGRARHRATISGHTTTYSPDPEFYWCCEEMAANAVPWRDGVVVTISAAGYGCEPAGDCSSQLFCYLRGSDSTAVSEWTNVPWQPASADSINGWLSHGCVTYDMILVPVVRASAIRFEPRLPAGAKVGDILLRAVTDYVNCFWSRRDHESVTVELLPTQDAEQGERIVVRIDDPVKLETALVRVVGITENTFTPALFRVEGTVAGRHGYLTREGLKALGFGVE